MASQTLHASVRLRAAPESIGVARRSVRRSLEGWGLEHLVHVACLLVSELSTNAVLHARTDLEVLVERRAGCVRVTVLDGSPRLAVRRRYGLDAGTGRGLGMVEAMAARWGCEDGPAPWAKGVWFELSDDPAGQEPSPEGALYGEDWLALVKEL
jgi:anti-sigma regulatory factor (Ser/Thr protein kinase)